MSYTAEQIKEQKKVGRALWKQFIFFAEEQEKIPEEELDEPYALEIQKKKEDAYNAWRENMDLLREMEGFPPPSPYEVINEEPDVYQRSGRLGYNLSRSRKTRVSSPHRTYRRAASPTPHLQARDPRTGRFIRMY